MHVLDSLVIVHHQTTAKSMIFDIKVGGVWDGILTTHRPVVDNIAIVVPENISTDPNCSYELDVELCMYFVDVLFVSTTDLLYRVP